MKSKLPFMFSCFLLMATSGAVQAGDSKVALIAGYWSNFVEHWKTIFQQQNGISMAVVGVGVVALIIITRGKWQK